MPGCANGQFMFARTEPASDDTRADTRQTVITVDFGYRWWCGLTVNQNLNNPAIRSHAIGNSDNCTLEIVFELRAGLGAREQDCRQFAIGVRFLAPAGIVSDLCQRFK